MILNAVIGFIVAAVASWVAIYALMPFFSKLGFIDIPNERSSHDTPKPRAGGIAIILGVVSGSIWFFAAEGVHLPWTFWIASFIVAALGIVDDRIGLPVWTRLIFQAIAISLVLHHSGAYTEFPLPEPLNVGLGWVGFVVAFIWVLGIMNIFNFLDGIDGFAGAQTLVAAVVISLILFGSPMSFFTIVLAGAALGFLFWNWDPSKVFMGDVGSSLLGFWFAIIPFFTDEFSLNSMTLIVVLALWVFLSDGAFTIIRRGLNKEKIWKPHRSHLYQRLNILGWRHRKIVSILVLFMVVMGAFAVLLALPEVKDDFAWTALAIGLALFVLYAAVVARLESKSEKT
jgi:UDP-N-acetylmuramyl pentapeptide phosphotransferase/UDP-N-acetylglucosamine-1-phosphate transferase